MIFFQFYSGATPAGLNVADGLVDLSLIYQFTGVTMPPPLAVTGPMTVVLTTDSSSDTQVFPPNSLETGFFAKVTFSSTYCTTSAQCNGHGSCSPSSGFCSCDSGGMVQTVRLPTVWVASSFLTPREPLAQEVTETTLPVAGLFSQQALQNGILLQFSSFSVEPSFDLVHVYDGFNTHGVLLGTFSGTDLTAVPSLYATSGSMYVVFTSDANGHYGGFSANYSSVSSMCTKDRHCGEGEHVIPTELYAAQLMEDSDVTLCIVSYQGL